MTDAEIYEFDLNGYIIYRNHLPADMVTQMNGILDRELEGNDGWSFSFLDRHPVFMDLMAYPKTLQAIRTMIGDWLRLDHAYGIQMTHEIQTQNNLHGGPRHDMGEHQYQWVHGRMYNGLIVVVYALKDVNPGDGGLICVPGSHKANTSYVPDVNSHLVVNPTLKAGDMLIFTEALIHGTRRWTSDQPRRSLLYKYSPGYSTWAEAGWNQKYEPLATNDLQRALLRPPSVGHREKLPFPEA